MEVDDYAIKVSLADKQPISCNTVYTNHLGTLWFNLFTPPRCRC